MRADIEFIKAALVDEMAKRSQAKDLEWVDNERLAVALAANRWASAHGISARVSVHDVERVEPRAVGHVDYASKLSLYVADLLRVPR